MTDDTQENPIVPPARGPLDRFIETRRWERNTWVAAVVIVVVLCAVLIPVAIGLYKAVNVGNRVEGIAERIEQGQARDRCEARQLGEYLASFSDYLGVPPSDPFRRELDEHLKRVSDEIRRSGQGECVAVPPGPTYVPTTTTTTTEPPPSTRTASGTATTRASAPTTSVVIATTTVVTLPNGKPKPHQ